MVEQNARRCLQIADRGYERDLGCDAYTGTGCELVYEPMVIELYLGTLTRVIDEKKYWLRSNDLASTVMSA